MKVKLYPEDRLPAFLFTYPPAEMYMEKRRHPRILLTDLSIDVSDGLGFFSGSIHNLSRFGICVNDLPAKLDQNAKRLSVVVSGKGRNFKMVGRPRWTEAGKFKKNIGVEIVNAPWGWTEFVMSMEPQVGMSWLDEIRI